MFFYLSPETSPSFTNLTLLKSGISSTILDMNPTWDMYVTTAVYGNYGGQLSSRVYSGINAYDNSQERI